MGGRHHECKDGFLSESWSWARLGPGRHGASIEPVPVARTELVGKQRRSEVALHRPSTACTSAGNSKACASIAVLCPARDLAHRADARPRDPGNRHGEMAMDHAMLRCHRLHCAGGVVYLASQCACARGRQGHARAPCSCSAPASSPAPINGTPPSITPRPPSPRRAAAPPFIVLPCMAATLTLTLTLSVSLNAVSLLASTHRLSQAHD
eukprot:3939599-Rhodomonas_salina.1